MGLLSLLFCLNRHCCGRRKFSKRTVSCLLPIFLLLAVWYLCFISLFLPQITDHSKISNTPFDDLVPSDPFDLYWTMWTTSTSSFRGRHVLVLESVFIHHPNATIIMLSPTLNDTQLFLPYRQRGYRIYAFNVSIHHFLQWKWYLNKQTKLFLQQWNSSGTYFYTHLTDYFRTIALYLYGGTYMDMDALILQPLPRQEFIGQDRTEMGVQCSICIPNSAGLYLAPGVFRLRPRRAILRRIHQQTFTINTYDPSCFNCAGPKAYTFYIMESQENNDPELANLRLLEPHRLYPFMWTEPALIFNRVQSHTPLELADLMKRSYSLHLFGHVSDRLSIARHSLIDLLFDRFDLGKLRSKVFSLSSISSDKSNIAVQFIHPRLYIYTPRKQGRFVGRDVIYLRVDDIFARTHFQWNITIYAQNGTISLPSHLSVRNRNQAEINQILHLASYTPSPTALIDTLVIDGTSEHVNVTCSVTILIFSQWVTVLTKTMGAPDRWPVIRRLAASIERYFPGTNLHVASDWGTKIDVDALLNFSTPDNITGQNLKKNIIVYDLPEDCGLSASRNYLINSTRTPLFFLLDDDFELQEDSHLDILLEIIYAYNHIDIVAGKIPQDIKIYYDYAGFFLRYNQTIELVLQVPEERKNQILYPRTIDDKLNVGNPCRRVDFVPNVFMGRTEVVRSVLWDDELKLAEHEDFFLRFGQANRTIYTCDHINVHHIQVHWWLDANHPYYKKRARVFSYYKNMLRKHNVRRLISFDITNFDFPEVP